MPRHTNRDVPAGFVAALSSAPGDAGGDTGARASNSSTPQNTNPRHTIRDVATGFVMLQYASFEPGELPIEVYKL
ncbi:MAG TPA: hypothetical protein VMX16_07690 [Terriglobia bacterium]|nr:hypothetical protein [Terriglobia bacterium]